MNYEEIYRNTKIQEYIKSMLYSNFGDKHIISNVKWKFGERIYPKDINDIRKDKNVNYTN